jgi:hypothetical protein
LQLFLAFSTLNSKRQNLLEKAKLNSSSFGVFITEKEFINLVSPPREARRVFLQQFLPLFFVFFFYCCFNSSPFELDFAKNKLVELLSMLREVPLVFSYNHYSIFSSLSFLVVMVFLHVSLAL